MRLGSEIPARLYKYLPRMHVRAFVHNGDLLFRNLTSFRQMEHNARGDVREGCHVDSPDDDITITVVGTGHQISGPFSMRTDVNGDRVYVFCMSRIYAERMYDTFGSDACIVITDPREFIRRCEVALKRLLLIEPIGCIAGNVEYYESNKPASLSIDDPFNIPFLKSGIFGEQQEFRLCFGKKRAFRIRKRLITDRKWETAPDHLEGTPQQKLLQVGDVSDITEVRFPELVAA